MITAASFVIIFLPPDEDVPFREASLREYSATLPDFSGSRGEEADIPDRSAILNSLSDQHTSASEWGERVSGVKNRHDTEEKVIALTFDACGGPTGNGVDEELLSFLTDYGIPATLFMNYRWIEDHEDRFLELADNPLFTIENHGTAHLPLSVEGRTAWGIEGTASPEEVVDEVLINQEHIASLTGKAPSHFRSGTAYYDEQAVKIVEMAGLTAVNYDVLGDAGATYSAAQVESALLESRPGSIVLLHMNQPSSGTAEGVKQAVPQLLDAGYTFVHLGDYPLTE
ncbi:polysaccharide deacetylase [Alteribacter natronophilus]|nr:polysaccharide deacetylase [Alteribacter natronophilus]